MEHKHSYKFRGKPDFQRILKENPESDIIAVTLGHDWAVMLRTSVSGGHWLRFSEAMSEEIGKHGYTRECVTHSHTGVDGRAWFARGHCPDTQRVHSAPLAGTVMVLTAENYAAVRKIVEAWESTRSDELSVTVKVF